ncbi:unnamed protein product [Sphenostylis stenocarpa]|uniref:Uncharacterized protein n=1 Tax=Sphenostylis stenocarpa TaxID=92480 RepID=A0AA86V819_9FABA|nr:unnamed protein product [Sphenostylis stenocarpa]
MLAKPIRRIPFLSFSPRKTCHEKKCAKGKTWRQRFLTRNVLVNKDNEGGGESWDSYSPSTSKVHRSQERFDNVKGLFREEGEREPSGDQV